MVLQQVIKEYIAKKEPVGSLQISNNSQVSSATIRNYFKRLSDDGLLLQPHISSGRVPTINALKSHWNNNLNVKQVRNTSVSQIKNASEENDIFCIIATQWTKKLESIENIDSKYLLLCFDDVGVAVPFSTKLQKFLNDLKGLDVSDVRKIAYQVCAFSLLKMLEVVQDRQIERFGMQFIAKAFESQKNWQKFFEIINGSIFDTLENGIYFESILPKGYMCAMQEININDKKQRKNTKMLCAGALDSNFERFYEQIQS